MTYNIIAKCVKGKEFIIAEMVATSVSKKYFEFLKSNDCFDNHFKDTEQFTWRYIPFKETDFTWWQRIRKYLTRNKLYYGVYFDIDYFGNVTKF